MGKQGQKRKSPWIREPLPFVDYSTPHNASSHSDELTKKLPRRFRSREANLYLDIHTKRAALKVSPSVVSLVSYSGDEVIYQSSGTIIESDNSNRGIVLTSANLIRRPTEEVVMENTLADNLKVVVYLSGGRSFEGEVHAHDFHYNLAVIRFQSDTPLMTAKLTPVDDSISVDPNLCNPEDKSYLLRPHSSSPTFNLVPGDAVIAVGRYFAKPFDIMAAPGEFRLDRCEYDCKELFMVTCCTTRCGDGGPLINLSGEVIGIAFYDLFLTPIMPINIAYKWWEHNKTFGEPRRPSLGMEVTNVYVADLDIIEMVIQKFPNFCKGVIVEKVIPGSSADSAGIHQDDVIVRCGGKAIQSFLEFFEIMWDKVGDVVELVVARADHVTPLHLNMAVVESKSDELNSWRHWN